MFSALTTFLVFSLIFLVCFSGMTAVVWLMAQVLRLLFSFSLFEAMLLSTFFSSFAAYTLYQFSGLADALSEAREDAELISRGINRVRRIDTDMVDEIVATENYDRDAYKYIPADRFYKDESERTWENWLLKEIANDIYAEFQHKASVVPNLNDTQTQELAIRLSEFGVNILKRKTSRARKLTITKNQLMREIEKSGQRAYDDIILRLAVSSQNMNADYYYGALLEVVHNKRWKQPATIKDEA